MSNVLRVQMKKFVRSKNKNKSAVTVGTPTAVEKGKKKAISVSSPPEGSPNHQYHHPHSHHGQVLCVRESMCVQMCNFVLITVVRVCQLMMCHCDISNCIEEWSLCVCVCAVPDVTDRLIAHRQVNGGLGYLSKDLYYLYSI